ncbi:MAG TPA: hypothetical protein VLB73_04460 [Patescibacteria group bacterium]|nr:hypothetical protein [Patescibacteria group bacterium]
MARYTIENLLGKKAVLQIRFTSQGNHNGGRGGGMADTTGELPSVVGGASGTSGSNSHGGTK